MRKVRNQIFITEFSQRLNHALQKKGLSSNNAKSGVRVAELAQAAKCSVQMAHRYVYGTGLPDFDGAKRIADWLEIPVAWLLYGENTAAPNPQKLSFDANHVAYVLQKVLPHFITDKPQEVEKFILELLDNITQIQADPEILLRYVDAAVSGIRRF